MVFLKFILNNMLINYTISTNYLSRGSLMFNVTGCPIKTARLRLCIV